MDNSPDNLPTEKPKIKFAFKSKEIAIVILSLALLFTTFSSVYLFQKNSNLLIQQKDYVSQKKPFTQASALVKPSDHEINKINCTETECLIGQGNSSYGYATLNGFYKRYEGTQWEWFNEEVFCDGFLITGGNETIIQEFRSAAEGGNTVNKIIDGELIVNINLSSLSEAERNRIINSSVESPVEIGFVKRVPRGTGVSTCFSFIDIFSVK